MVDMKHILRDTAALEVCDSQMLEQLEYETIQIQYCHSLLGF